MTGWLEEDGCKRTRYKGMVVCGREGGGTGEKKRKD